ncbi:MAG TPA: type IV pilus assembly protein PilM [Chthoniobacterales bacterium]|nr:type IV pilus assembly protein PilM [Chthoniobacterales bacterium]
MPGPARLITLNLGSQTVGVGEFRVAHGGLVLVNYRLREVPLDPETGQRRDAQVASEEAGSVLRGILHQMHIPRRPVNYALPAQSVFARFVKLPPVGQEKLDKIISFEAQQNVPFPLDEVVWDYQLVGGGLGEQIQVVLVAIKVDLLDQINASVEGTGLQTSIVDVAPMALYNAFRYSYPDAGDCSLLLDIGARTTNILFIEPGRIYLRSIPLGGSAITAAIAREFNEPFTAAETRKKQDGFVGLGGAYAEPADPNVGRVSKIARSTMTRLHAELMRSITHYRAQQHGNRPARIFLCGGGAGMPYMREFFHEKFQVPIEFFNPLQKITVAESAPMQDVARSAHLLGELVGLALRGVTVCPMELNLRPASVVRRHDLEKRRLFFIAAAACILVALLGWSAYYTRAAQVAHQAAQAISQKNGAMHVTEGQLDKLKKQITSLDNTATPLITAVNDRNFWPQILEQLNSRLPESDIWITDLAATSGGKLLGVSDKRAAELGATPPPTTTAAAPAVRVAPAVTIDGINLHGLYLWNPKQQEIVVDYLRNLAKSPLFNVDPGTPERFVKSNSVPNDSEWAFPFELQLTLKKPVKMP